MAHRTRGHQAKGSVCIVTSLVDYHLTYKIAEIAF